LSEHDHAWRQAGELYRWLRSGNRLQPLTYRSGLILDQGEVEYTDAQCEAYRYFALENASYESTTMMFGGPIMLAATGLASAAANSARRKAAIRGAQAQWRCSGPTRAILTSERLLSSCEGQWLSFYLSGIREVTQGSQFSIA
jgi:hypothetical protein